MFFVEFGASLKAGSTALQGDALDMLGDAAVYGMSLWAVDQSREAKTKLAGIKGGIMVILAASVFAGAIYRYDNAISPEGNVISGIGLLALLANATCAFLLYRLRSDDINMRSVWLCSRNDVIANIAVIAAGGLVLLTGSLWPDLVVGLGIGTLVLSSAVGVLKEVRQAKRETQVSI
jgi:Co/Zn/Cd efflux system component